MNSNLRLIRESFIPLAIGLISMMGLCVALWIGLRPEPAPAPVVEFTATPFKYKLLATETYTPDPSLVTESPEFNFESGEATIDPEFFATPEFESIETLESLPTDESEGIATEDPLESTEEPVATDELIDDEFIFTEGIFDDTDYRINYIGDWTSELFGFDAAHDGTLFISTSMGNTAEFFFRGRQLKVGYFGANGQALGTATVVIDGNPYSVNQASGTSWTSPQLIFGEHQVVITHQTGEYMYVDYVEIH